MMVSCSENKGQAQTAFPTNQFVSPTSSAQKPIVASVIPDSETEISSLKDIQPTLIPEDTPEPLLASYAFPVWMKNPKINIVAALITNEIEKTRKMAFFNATTGEKYEILMPQNMSGYFWYDNTNFGFLADDLKTTFRLDLTNGQVTSEIVPSPSVRLLEPDWTGRLNGLKIVKESPSSQDFTLTSSWKPDYSKNATFTLSTKPNRDGITVINNITNETIWDLTTPSETYITVYAWSPTNNNLLAYIQGKYADPTDFITKGITLNIVDVVNGKTLATYSGDFGRMSWSPDGDKILYQNAKSIYSNYGVGFTEAPCILFLNSGEKRCLRSIPRIVPPGYTLATTGRYKWSTDNTKIYYTYLYISKESYSILGNLCVYDLISGHINCPTTELEALIEHDVGYKFSPDEDYIYLCISESTLLNDYVGNSRDGIIRSDGTGFFSWTSSIREDGPNETCSYSYNVLWRPLLE